MLVPMETTTPELARDLQVAHVARPVVSSPTPTIHLAYGEIMASIGQDVVVEAPCAAVVKMVAEQLMETIYIVPVVPLAPAPQRVWAWWCAGAALLVGNMIVI